MSDRGPVEEKEFERLMQIAGQSNPAAGTNPTLAVAVSGGADSMALSLLVARWGKAIYLTFDHGLRAESANEAQKVGEWLEARGLKHVVLQCEAEKPAADIQAWAREARYRGLESWCRDNGIGVLLLAHHLEDQAETFLMRLARGSGVDGLAAMASESAPNFIDGGPSIVRPLLRVSKARLKATLEAMEQPWIEDPSNEDPAFTRVKVRQFLSAEPLEGLNPKRLAATARRMARARTALDRMTGQLIGEAVSVESGGFGMIDLDVLGHADEEIALRVLSRLLRYFGAQGYPPRLEPLERLFGELARDGFAGATLAGCQLIPRVSDGASKILILREENAITDEFELLPGESRRFDDRFQINAGSNLPPLHVSKLGEAGWKEVVQVNSQLRDVPIPHDVRKTLPAFRWNGEIVAVAELLPPQRELSELNTQFVPKLLLLP